jgi:predicted SAM-dependent methyltransferase
VAIVSKLLLKLYRKIPFDVRTHLHRFFDFFNESKLLLNLVGPVRQMITIRKLAEINGNRKVIVGESYAKEGWLVSNYQVFAKNFIDITRRFAKNSSVTLIYADNVIEHLDAVSAKRFIQNSYNALIPGGRIRIVTPDCRAIANTYVQNDRLRFLQFVADLSQHKLRLEEPIDLLRVTFSEFGHSKGCIYDEESLTNLLESCGFSEVVKHSPSSSNVNEFRHLEKRVSPSDAWSQMCVEATKVYRV